MHATHSHLKLSLASWSSPAKTNSCDNTSSDDTGNNNTHNTNNNGQVHCIKYNGNSNTAFKLLFDVNIYKIWNEVSLNTLSGGR